MTHDETGPTLSNINDSNCYVQCSLRGRGNVILQCPQLPPTPSFCSFQGPANSVSQSFRSRSQDLVKHSSSSLSKHVSFSFKMDVIAVTILALMLTILLSQVFKWAFEHLKLRKKLSSIPGPSSLPFIGMSLQVRKIPVDGNNDQTRTLSNQFLVFTKIKNLTMISDILQYGMDLNFKYKNGMIIMWVGTEPIVHIRKPHQMEVIEKNSSEDSR